MEDPRIGGRRWKWLSRGAAVIAVALAVTAGGTGVANASSNYPTLDLVNVRLSPSTDAPILYQIPKGQKVSIDCYVTGEKVSGTTIWNRLSGAGGYITDSLLLTGSDDPVVPKCATGSTAPSKSSADPASCYADSCAGLDPQLTSCVQDARTLKRWKVKIDGSYYGKFEMRYSPKCHANWVRFLPIGGVSGFLDNWSGGTIHATPKIWRDGVAASEQGIANRTDASMLEDPNSWTKMVNADGKTCGSVTVTSTERSDSGQGERNELGVYEPPCIS